MDFIKRTALGLVVAVAVASPFASKAIDSSGGSFYMAGNYTAEFASTGTLSAAEGLKPNNVTPADPRFVFSGKPDSLYEPKYKIGHTGAVRVGYAYASNPRIELEGLYSVVKPKPDADPSNEAFTFTDLKTFVPGTSPSIDYKQDGYSHFAVMLNGYYDVISNDLPVTPYFGGGVGISRATFLSKTRNALAYQAKAGISVSLGSASKIRAFVGYRYFGVTEGDGFEDVRGTAQNDSSPSGFGKVAAKVPYSSHGFEVGIIAAM